MLTSQKSENLRRVRIRGGARRTMHSEGTFETTANWVPAATWLGYHVAAHILSHPIVRSDIRAADGRRRPLCIGNFNAPKKRA